MMQRLENDLGSRAVLAWRSANSLIYSAKTTYIEIRFNFLSCESELEKDKPYGCKVRVLTSSTTVLIITYVTRKANLYA